MIPIRYATITTPVRAIPIRFKADNFEPPWMTPEFQKAASSKEPDWVDKLANWASQNPFCQFLHHKIFPKTLYPAWLFFLDRLETASTLAGRRAPRFLFFGKDRNTVNLTSREEDQINPQLEQVRHIQKREEDNRYLISNTFSMCFWFIFGSQALVEATKPLSNYSERLDPPQPVKLSTLDRFFLQHAFKINPDSIPQPEETPPPKADTTV